MATLVAICQPYKRKFLNYVDILIFTNLAIINCMTHYLYETLKYREDFTPSLSVFVVQYVLVFLPLVYMLMYIVWRKTEKYHRLIERIVREKFLKCCLTSRYQQLDSIVRDDVSRSVTTSHGVGASAFEANVPPEPTDDMEAIIARSKDPNTYQSKVPVTIVGMHSDECSWEASVRQFTPRDSGENTNLLGADSGTSSSRCIPYGSTNSTSSTGSTERNDSGCQAFQS